MNDSDIYLSENKLTISSINPNTQVIVKQEKIKDVPEGQRIKLNDDTIFRFESSVKDDNLSLKLSEIGAFSPYIYEVELSLDEMINIHKMFKSCINIEEAKTHIDKLFELKQIHLTQEEKDHITFNIAAHDISIEQKFKIDAMRKITTEKDESLMKLYEIEKKQLKLWKELELFAEKFGTNKDSLINKIKSLKPKNHAGQKILNHPTNQVENPNYFC
jgi:hypothetical protein